MIEVLGPADPEGDAAGATITSSVQRALKFLRSEKYPAEYLQEAQQLGLRRQ